MRKALAIALVTACAPSVERTLPAPPAGATAVAIVGIDSREGVLLPLPLTREVNVSGAGGEAHFYDLKLSASTRVVFTRTTCDDRMLPAPIASFVLEESGATATTSRGLRAPDLGCDVQELSLAPPSNDGSCRTTELTIGTCEITLDRSSCASDRSSTWPTKLDGTPCGPRAEDPVCRGSQRPRAIAAGECGDGTYALYPRRELDTIDVEKIPLDGAFADTERQSITDLLVLPDTIIAVGGVVENRQGCTTGGGSTLIFYDRASRTLSSTTAPSCLFGLVATPEGGFWATFQIEADDDELQIGRFDPRGRLVESATIALPSDITEPHATREWQTVTMLDTSTGATTELTIVINSFERDARNTDRYALVRVRADRLATVALGTRGGAVRGVDVDRDAQLLAIADDKRSGVDFFAYPIDGLMVPARPPLIATATGIMMGPVLAMSDRGVWLVGRTGATGGLDVYAGDATPQLQSVFVREPLASAQAFARIGPTRALALFHLRKEEAGVTDGPTWVTVIDFADPGAAIPGIETNEIGTGRVFRTQLEGGAWWVALSRTREIVGLRL